MGKPLKNALLIAGISIIIIFLFMIIGDKVKANILKENQETQAYQNWLSENCDCLAHERLFCPSGFQMVNSTCINVDEKTFTNKLAGCSEYNCSGEIKNWDNDNGKWN